MRFLEIVIPVLLSIYLLWSRPRPVFVRFVPAFVLAITLLHFFLEGYRWQMIPLYLITLLLALLALKKPAQTKGRPGLTTLLTFALVLIFSSLPILLPVPSLPAPGGPFQVGTTSFEMLDTAREEIYSEESGEPRRFMIQVWYPASITPTDIQAPQFANPDVYTPALSALIGMPSFFLDHLSLAKTPAYQAGQIADSAHPFPLIVFSSGWKGYSAANTGQAIELASHGFVVISMQHTYGAIVTVFPDGTVVPNNPNALPADEDDPNYELVANKVVKQWSEDISFVLDQLENSSGDAGTFFSGRLDLNRIGLYGHSTGGGAAIEFCALDPRCKAILGMDAWMRPVAAEVIASGVSQPSFFMFSEQWAEVVGNENKNNELFGDFFPNNSNSFGAIEILGTNHYDFSDLPLLSPIASQLGLKGPLNGPRVTEIVNSYLVAFFQLSLMEKPSSMFSGAFNDYPEVKIFE